MIRCSIFAAGRPICESWRGKQCKRYPKFLGHIHLSNGSSRPSAGSIWIVCSFGLQMTWNESWSGSRTTTMRLACIKGYPATRPGRKRATQHLSQLALRITVGKAIATSCLTCQSLLEWQFARYRHGIAGLAVAIILVLFGMEECLGERCFNLFRQLGVSDRILPFSQQSGDLAQDVDVLVINRSEERRVG